MADKITLLPPEAQGQFVSNASARALDDDPNIQKLIGDGTTHLVCNGLLEVDQVWVGNTEIPLFERLEYPLDGSEHPRMGIDNHQMVALDRTATGETVLLRSQRSNDGIWQKDQPVYIKGTWQTEKKKAS